MERFGFWKDFFEETLLLNKSNLRGAADGSPLLIKPYVQVCLFAVYDPGCVEVVRESISAKSNVVGFCHFFWNF
jgi:hypothetical protein